jgi:hypothetical protein
LIIIIKVVKKRRKKTRYDWRCGSVETCRKAAPAYGRVVRTEFAEAVRLQSKNYGRSKTGKPQEDLSPFRDQEEKGQEGC